MTSLFPSLRAARRWFPLIVVAGLLPATAHAAEKYTIRPNVPAGTAATFISSQTQQMTVKINAGGQEIPPQEQGGVMTREGRVVAKDARDGIPNHLEITFGRNCTNVQRGGGQEQTETWPLAGKTVNIKKAADGTLSNDLQGIPEAVSAEVNQMGEFDTSMYPREPVGVGDEWTPDTARMRAQFQLTPDDKVTMKCRLLAVGQVRGRRTYDVGVTGSLAKVQQGVNLTMDLGGVVQYDAATGMPLQGDIVAKLSLRGEPQPGATLTGDGQVKITQSYTIEGGGGAPAVIGDNPLDPRPAPPRPAGGNPLDPQPAPRPGGNPLDRPANPLDRPAERPAAPANPLHGQFKGDELSAEFQIAGPKVTGTITKGGKQYRVTGTTQGNRVVGAFEVAGVEFNFAATLDGETLTLDSEGNKYTMKKVAGAAPAPAPAPERPRNPLE